MTVSQKNKDYWRKRFEKNQENLLKPSDEYLVELERIYNNTLKEIERDIAVWYQRFADNNVVDMATARQMLNKKELEELRLTVDEYIKKGKENGISADWSKQLENASAMAHINRLESLKLQTRGQIENLYNSYYNGVKLITTNIYKDSYYTTAFEIAKGTGVGTSLTAIDTNKLEKVISKPWTADGSNFSKRIWEEHRPQLVNTIHQQLTRGIITGKSSEKLIDEVAKTMKASKNNAARLVLTESAYFASKGQQNSYKALGVKKYEILGTLDNTTCSTCGSLDGQVFDFDIYEVGSTAPPFHPWCRCTTIPYFDDEFTEGEQRAARDENGKTVYVDANIKYEDWKKEFVKNEVANDVESGIIKNKNVKDLGEQKIEVHLIGKIDKNLYNCITKDIICDEVIITDERIQHIKDRHPNDFEQYCLYMKEIVKNPDYIILGNKPNTALILKSFTSDTEQFKTILRLVTSNDNKEFKNSIITFMKINNKEWDRLLRNKEILYKRE